MHTERQKNVIRLLESHSRVHAYLQYIFYSLSRRASDVRGPDEQSHDCDNFLSNNSFCISSVIYRSPRFSRCDISSRPTRVLNDNRTPLLFFSPTRKALRSCTPANYTLQPLKDWLKWFDSQRGERTSCAIIFLVHNGVRWYSRGRMPHGCTVIMWSTYFVFMFVFIFIASLHVNVLSIRI